MKAARHWAEVLLQEYEPRLVVLTGASGGVGPQVELGDLVLAESIYQLAGRKVVARYRADADMLALAHRVAAVASLRPIRRRQPRIVEAGVATADRVVRDRVWGAQMAQEHGILAVEMEGSAIAHVCAECGVPFLAVRAVSDVIGRRWQAWTMIRYLVPTQRNAERLVLALIHHLSQQGWE